MTQERLFRQKHPVLTGFLILGMMVVFFWGGIAFFVASFHGASTSADLFGGEGVPVGVVTLIGVITDAREAVDQLSHFARMKSVKAIVVRIDSPGGAVGASQELFREISRVNKSKPIVASMGSVAASGGFYAALGAAKILASPGTLTGSMGVILKFPNLTEIFDKIGYKDEVIKSGKMKDIGSPSRALTDEERTVLQTLISEVHEQFLRDIATSRGLDIDAVRTVADGRIFTGETAHKLGLVDDFGNINDAARVALSLAGLDGEEATLLYPDEDPLSFMKLLMEGRLFSRMRDAVVLRSPILAYEWNISP